MANARIKDFKELPARITVYPSVYLAAHPRLSCGRWESAHGELR